MKRAIIESPYSGEVERNMAYLKRAILDSLQRGEAPIASHKLYTDILDDNIPEQRALGIAAGFAWREVADFTAFYCDYGESEGMKEARLSLQAHGFVIRYIGKNP